MPRQFCHGPVRIVARHTKGELTQQNPQKSKIRSRNRNQPSFANTISLLADIRWEDLQFRFVPEADITRGSPVGFTLGKTMIAIALATRAGADRGIFFASWWDRGWCAVAGCGRLALRLRPTLSAGGRCGHSGLAAPPRVASVRERVSRQRRRHGDPAQLDGRRSA